MFKRPSFGFGFTSPVNSDNFGPFVLNVQSWRPPNGPKSRPNVAGEPDQWRDFCSRMPVPGEQGRLTIVPPESDGKSPGRPGRVMGPGWRRELRLGIRDSAHCRAHLTLVRVWQCFRPDRVEVLLALNITDSPPTVGVAPVFSRVTGLPPCHVSISLVDRVDQRRVMIFRDPGRRVLFLLMPLVRCLSGPNLWIVFGLARVTGVVNVGNDYRIIAASGRPGANFVVECAAGPSRAAALTSRVGFPPESGWDAPTFPVSAVSRFVAAPSLLRRAAPR